MASLSYIKNIHIKSDGNDRHILTTVKLYAANSSELFTKKSILNVLALLRNTIFLNKILNSNMQ